MEYYFKYKYFCARFLCFTYMNKCSLLSEITVLLLLWSNGVDRLSYLNF
jgi:hypothetical protein